MTRDRTTAPSPPRTELNALVSAAVSFVAAAAALAAIHGLRRRRTGTRSDSAPLKVWDLLIAIAVAAAVTVALLLPAWAVVPSAYTPLHVAYFAIVCTLPLISLGTLWLARASLRESWIPASASVMMILLAPLGIYMSHIEPNWLRLDSETVRIDSRREGDHAVRVGVISDIQSASPGAHEFGAVERLMAQGPDVILVPGDVAQLPDDEFERQLPRFTELLSGLSAPGGVHLVVGDVDGGPERLERIVSGTDVQLLVDETARVTVGDRELLIGGLRRQGDGSAAVRDELVAEPDDGAITILFAHRPDEMLELPDDSRIDLSVAGHTHGGQVALPFLGPPLTASDVPHRVARGGLHEMSGNTIYVSTGVGAERAGAPQIRFLVRPSIGVIDLH